MVDGGHPGTRTPTALVVAVDEDRRDQLSRELEAAGLEPVLATDGRQAERSAKVAVPDALVLDQGLPGLALFRLYSTLRGLPGGADVPIFFIGQIGIDTPTDHYLDAGLSLREVVDRVRDELGMPAGAASETVRPTELHGAAVEHGSAAMSAPTHADVEPPVAAERVAPTIQPPIEPANRVEQTVPPAEPIAAPMPPPVVTPVVTPEGPRPTEEPLTEERSPVPAGDPLSRISRLDVVLLRLGLVLLLLGGAVLLLRPDTSTQPIAPPDLPTATPAATRTASPSPAAHAKPAAVETGR